MRICFFLVFSVCLHAFAQTDKIGPGRAVYFDGVDDYIDLGNIMDDLNAPFTVSAWINLDPSVAGACPILVSQDNAPLYNGFWFVVNPTAVFIETGDGFGGDSPAYRRGKLATVPDLRGRWVHVTAVVKADYSIELYLNGINVGGSATGLSPYPMASNYPTDVAKIGYFFSNTTVYRFKGLIDEVRVWKRALTEPEIRDKMCKRIVTTDTDLIGYWGFDETSGVNINDYSTKASHGTMMNNPTRVFSGAAVGDQSVLTYPASLAGQSLTMDDLKISNVKPAAKGIQIYKVNNKPSRITGLDASKQNMPYYGVFIASVDQGNTFDVSNTGNNLCDIYTRQDNSFGAWAKVNSFTNFLQMGEFIPSSGAKTNFNLGMDTVLCDKSVFTIDSKLPQDVGTFQWNTGQTTTAIQVMQTGKYILTVTAECGNSADTIQITMLKSPAQVSFGPDISLCNQDSYTLHSNATVTNGTTLEWSTKDTGEFISITKSGTYSFRASNFCKTVGDTIRVLMLKTPAAFSLGTDISECVPAGRLFQPYPERPEASTYEWQDGSTNERFTAQGFGTYWVTVQNECGIASDTIKVKELSPLLGQIPNIFTPNNDNANQTFVLPTEGLSGNQLILYNRWGQPVYKSADYRNDWDGGDLPVGVYFYQLRTACDGEKRGSVTIAK